MKIRATERSFRGRRDWRIRPAIVAAAVGGYLALSGAAADGATPHDSGCIASSAGVDVHFVLGAPDTSSEPGVAGLTLTGFDRATCDGEPVVVTLSGNRLGDPARSADILMSTYDSAVDPCTGAELDSPAVIAAGSIALQGCAGTQDSALAAPANLHDLTLLRVSVAGEPVNTEARPDNEVLGVEGFAGGDGDGQAGAGTTDGSTAAADEPPGVLAATGGPASSWLVLGGLLLLAGAGSLLVSLVRDRRSALTRRHSRARSANQ